MLSDYGPLLVLLIVALMFPIGGIATSKLLGLTHLRPDHPNPVKNDTYRSEERRVGKECRL